MSKSKKSQLIEEARRWGIEPPAKATVAQIEGLISEAKARAHAAPTEAPAPPEPEPAKASGAGKRYRTICNVILGKGVTVEPGQEVELSAAQAESLLKQGAVEQV